MTAVFEHLAAIMDGNGRSRAARDRRRGGHA